LRQYLNGAKIGAGFEHVRRAAVSEDMRSNAPVDPGAPPGQAACHSDALTLERLVGPHRRREEPVHRLESVPVNLALKPLNDTEGKDPE
jgi:hypothetical protein